jgi:uncharacterized protein (TIGR02757 family)
MDVWEHSRASDVLRDFLNEKADFYNREAFIGRDPIQVPHQFSESSDIEIAAFLTAILSWGRKSTIISNAGKLVSLMAGGPHEFLVNSEDEDLARFLPFVHRTFNGMDCIYFLKRLREIYRHHGGLRTLFEESYQELGEVSLSIVHFRKIFFQDGNPGRTSKHLPDLERNAGGKRLNMFLRWMVRRDDRSVDFGLWRKIPMSALYIPLDVHTGNVARKLGLLERKQNDWKAVVALTGRLKQFDPGDPVKYDYALYGLGAFEGF